MILIYFIPIFVTAQNWDKAYIETLYADRMLDPIEGVWQMAQDAAKIAIVRSHDDVYDIYLLESPRLDIKPGTYIGQAVASPKRGYYDGRLESGRLGKSHKLKSETVTFNVSESGGLTIEPYKTGYSVSLKRWLYRIFGVSVVDNTNRRPKGLDGAHRIYPYIITEHLPICL